MILIVDDDVSFAEDVGRIFTTWSQGTLNVVVAHSVGQAIAHLQNPEIALIITDVRMPVFDGIQFLRLIHSKHPNIKKVALTGYADEPTRLKCLECGADFFLEKPRDVIGFESLYNVVRELYLNHMIDVANDGFSGMLAKANLGEVIQMLCITGGTMIFEVGSSHCHGHIYIKSGKIIHAETNFCQGYDAFYQIMTLKGGSFSVIEYEDPEQITIKDSWEKLLIESARMMDEANTITADMEHFGRLEKSSPETVEKLIEQIPAEKMPLKLDPQKIPRRETEKSIPEKKQTASENNQETHQATKQEQSQRANTLPPSIPEGVQYLKMDLKHQVICSNMPQTEQEKMSDIAGLLYIKSQEIFTRCAGGEFKELALEANGKTYFFSGNTVSFHAQISITGKEAIRELRKTAVAV